MYATPCNTHITQAKSKKIVNSQEQQFTLNEWMAHWHTHSLTLHSTHVHVLKCNKITCKLLALNLKLFSIFNVRQIFSSLRARAYTKTILSSKYPSDYLPTTLQLNSILNVRTTKANKQNDKQWQTNWPSKVFFLLAFYFYYHVTSYKRVA